MKSNSLRRDVPAFHKESIAMSFSNLMPANGPFFLDVGASMLIHFKRGVSDFSQPGEDRGAQWMMADPVAPKRGEKQFVVQLQVSDFSKTRNYLVGPQTTEIVGSNGQVVGTINGIPDIIYSARVTNVGQNPAFFTIHGGGNT